MTKRKPSRKRGPFWGAKIQCDLCGDILQSTHVHDFQACACFRKGKGKGVAIDGGGEYCRMSAGTTTYTILDAGCYSIDQ